MDGISIFFIALGLAMDAFAVSVTGGAVMQDRLRSAFMAGLFFGAFQAFMPVIGFLGGLEFSEFAAGFDHWIAFGLLVFIGGKMIHESVTTGPGEQRVANLLNLRVLTFLAIATSIDALAVGVSFAFLDVTIIMPVVVIGIVTFALSFLGVFIGNRFVGFFEKRIEIIGGLILIGIGLKILLEDLFF